MSAPNTRQPLRLNPLIPHFPPTPAPPSTRPTSPLPHRTAAIRLRCLHLLQARPGLTPGEAAAPLQLEPAAATVLFRDLEELRLIEKSGTRRAGDPAEFPFQLNPQHPALEVLLEPTPEGIPPLRRL